MTHGAHDISPFGVARRQCADDFLLVTRRAVWFVAGRVRRGWHGYTFLMANDAHQIRAVRMGLG